MDTWNVKMNAKQQQIENARRAFFAIRVAISSAIAAIRTPEN